MKSWISPGVERFLDTPVKRYSSGMYVRLAFSVAAHLEPEILIVDEVLAVGDSKFQKKCIGKKEDISQSEGRTILFVSHNMGAVQMLCNRGVMLRNGQLVFDGEIGEAVRLYTEDHKQLEHVPLSERRDRCGDGFIRFTGYTLFNGDGEETNTIQLGTPAVIETRFECEEACSGDIQIETGFSPVGGLNHHARDVARPRRPALFPEGGKPRDLHDPEISAGPRQILAQSVRFAEQ